jgi:S1-C subfamily serine protease
MLTGREEAIRAATRAIAKNLFQSVAPEALENLETIEQRALPRGLADVRLGPLDEGLEVAALTLQALADAVRTRGDAIFHADTAQDGARIVIESVRDRLSHLERRDLAQKYLDALPAALRMALDGVVSTVSPLGTAPEAHRSVLRRCVLRIEDGPYVSTGFAISENGHILTAAHVALSFRTLQLAFLCGENLERRLVGQADVIHLDDRATPRRDVAILQVENQSWKELRSEGLVPAPLSLGWRARDAVLCMGYQEQQIAVTPRCVGASIHPWDPQLRISFSTEQPGKEGDLQDCLVLALPPMEAHIVHGMSGGPVLNTRTGSIFAMVTGAEREAWKRHDEDGESVWVLLSPGYGFAVPLTDVVKSWPEFHQHCATKDMSEGGSNDV